jgi:DNA-binding transcriptional ArsR family regulator
MVQYDLDGLSGTFAALADPTRREILERLAGGPTSVTALAGPFEMSVPGMLKHVRVLEDAGLVRTTKRGRVRECELGTGALDDAAAWLDSSRRRWERRLDRFERHVARTGHAP